MQNNILQFVFGLPRWTPLPVLYKISNENNMKLRFDRKNMAFFVNQFSAREFTAVSGSINEVNSIISNQVFNRLPCGATLEKYSRSENLSLDKIIPIMVPVIWDDCKHFVIRTQELDFQQRNLDPSIIKHMFAKFKSRLPPDCIILATDASKNENSTANVAINCFSDVVIKGRYTI
ncbi:hypothetical protein AVEN_104884-1 [Araneus ventricosus]|uniref:Uncharacterized protein n=1 Tax=Araneus ventricosus TaxID=182803 RepID=A0A4Y2FE52_ARAVE|nr:hypothetical protein AVEN_104884-1 [Araneus ventricosus]